MTKTEPFLVCAGQQHTDNTTMHCQLCTMHTGWCTQSVLCSQCLQVGVHACHASGRQKGQQTFYETDSVKRRGMQCSEGLQGGPVAAKQLTTSTPLQ